MRAQAELAATTERLAEAARRGPDPDAMQARLGALKLLVGDIITDVENGLPALADGGPGLAGRAARHLVGAGGKRVRPLLVILAARAAGASSDCSDTRASVIKLAQAAELVHAATLLHDDVLDDGRTRRGMPAARVLWGNAASVLGGDFLLIRALELTAATGVVGALGDLLAAIGRMIDGEALQLQHRGRSDLDAGGYIDVVDGKTASLFAWCGRAGARLAASQATSQAATADALGAYGLHLGRAFQIVDDVLDVEGDPRALGKSVLSDVREGKLTLPVLFALEREPSLRALLDACVAADADDAGDVAAAVARTGSAQAARERAREETARAVAALESLPQTPWSEALRYIAHELCARVA
ncbi:MAG TPA: polyprenyl synthetase family protein [Polyangia bacterium]